MVKGVMGVSDDAEVDGGEDWDDWDDWGDDGCGGGGGDIQTDS